MRRRDLGKVRTSPVTQIGNNDFGHVYKGEVTVQQPHIQFIVHDSVRPNVQLIPLHRVELKKKFWNEKGITFKQIDK
jgi:2-C-methyl-D-erythritol 4-phosphate cytidylyltransferase